MGAMAFGDPIKEVIQLNENTVWAGSPNRNDNPDAKEAFPVIKKLIFVSYSSIYSISRIDYFVKRKKFIIGAIVLKRKNHFTSLFGN